MRRALLALTLAFVVAGAAGLTTAVPAAASVDADATGQLPPPGVVSAAGSWSWPVAAPHPIARQFIAPATPYGAGHRGIDIRAPDGVVYAPAAGIVSFSGAVVDRPVLSIRHPGGLVSSFEPVQSDLVAGDAVSRGQLVGTLARGHCYTLCLHFGVRLDGAYVNPLIYLGEVQRSVLLPTRWP